MKIDYRGNTSSTSIFYRLGTTFLTQDKETIVIVQTSTNTIQLLNMSNYTAAIPDKIKVRDVYRIEPEELNKYIVNSFLAVLPETLCIDKTVSIGIGSILCKHFNNNIVIVEVGNHTIQLINKTMWNRHNNKTIVVVDINYLSMEELKAVCSYMPQEYSLVLDDNTTIPLF